MNDVRLKSSGMEYLYNPRSIAIVGASPHRTKPGGRPLAALIERGYEGRIVAVNPQYDDIDNVPCYPTLQAVPGDIELIVISVPAAGVLDVLRQGVKKGVRAAVIFSSGFAEVDEQGVVAQQQLTRLARQHGIRLLGPNCLGLMNLTNNAMASFAHIMDLEPVMPQTLAFVTQSGAFGAMIYSEATEAGVGFSSFASVGNEADVEVADCIEYLLSDPHAEVIGGYLEGARNGLRLRQVAEQALQIGKPIALLKVGRTGAGARAANSHTGSLAGDDQVYDAFFRQTGIIRINELSELTSFVHLHRTRKNFERTRVAILSGSGGHGVMQADICESLGLTVPEITGKTREALQAILPPFGSGRNPVDLTAAAGGDPTMMGRCLKELTLSPDIDVILMQAFFRSRESVEEVIAIAKQSEKPIVITARGVPTEEMQEHYQMLKDNGVAILPDGRTAAKAIADLSWYQRKVKRAVMDAAGEAGDEGTRHPLAAELLNGDAGLTEFDCKRILADYGIPVSRELLATSEGEAVAFAEQVGFPVAMKIQSPQILHKTEAGGIRLNVGDADAVRVAWRELVAGAKAYDENAEIRGVVISEMIGEGVEVIIGMTTDPVFGPVVMFGLGGIFVEVLKDVSFRVAPLKRRDAEEMLEEIKSTKVLEGVRGKPPANREALIDVIMKVSQLVTEHAGAIAELDINPLVVFPDGACAVDALITRR